MRRTIATFLVTALLSTSAPLMIRDHGQDPSGDFTSFVKVLKNIIRHLIPLDDGGTINPPKP